MVRGVACVLEALNSFFRVLFVVLFALFLPWLCLYHARSSKRVNKAPFVLGVENISRNTLRTIIPPKKNLKIGLITNQTGRDQKGQRTIDILKSKGISLAAIFTPKHGFNGKQSAHATGCKHDMVTGLPIVSWHEHTDAKSKAAQLYRTVDMLFFDLQDSGMRYGYVQTLFQVMKSAGKYNKTVVVLDRPNLLGGCMEGSLSSDTHATLPIPVRHGMTTGELAQYFNMYVLNTPTKLHVVPMKNYNRLAADHTKLAHTISPHLATADACYGHSFLGLLGEVGPFDIGIGTKAAFQCIALPEKVHFSKQQWYELRGLLKKFGIESKMYRYFSSRKKSHCNGLRLFISDINDVASFATVISVLRFFKRAGVPLKFSDRFNVAIGTSKVRDVVNGVIDRATLSAEANASLRSFFSKAARSFMYTPLPKVVCV